jgi:hypothetical protein
VAQTDKLIVSVVPFVPKDVGSGLESWESNQHRGTLSAKTLVLCCDSEERYVRGVSIPIYTYISLKH